MAKRNALGRGLGALINEANEVNNPAASIDEIKITEIEANPWQPRTTFDQEALDELSRSITEIGIIQPLTLRKIGDNRYQIIAGERRFRASKLAGLERVPAYIRETDDKNMLEMALVENIQREDLDAIEIALSYQRLIEECSLTQETLSDRVGKKRSTVSNYLRLLKLPAIIQKGIRERQITMGHARAIINVQDAETQVRKLSSDETPSSQEEKPKALKFPLVYENLKIHLSKHFATNVDFKIDNKGKGRIVIPFDSNNDLERIIGVLDKLNN